MPSLEDFCLLKASDNIFSGLGHITLYISYVNEISFISMRRKVLVEQF